MNGRVQGQVGPNSCLRKSMARVPEGRDAWMSRTMRVFERIRAEFLEMPGLRLSVVEFRHHRPTSVVDGSRGASIEPGFTGPTATSAQLRDGSISPG